MRHIKTCYDKLLSLQSLKNNIICDDQKIDIDKFIDMVNAFAYSLLDLGFKKGDVVTAYLPTCFQSAISFYACSKIGLTISFVHPFMPLSKLIYNIQLTKSKGLIFFDDSIKDTNVFSNNFILIGCNSQDFDFLLCEKSKQSSSYKHKNHHSFKNLLIGYQGKNSKILGDGRDILCIMHSGGTTDTPKLVKLTNNAINESANSLDDFITFKNDDYVVCCLPIFHAYGLCCSMHTCLIKGASLILCPNFSGDIINNLIKNYNVTTLIGVPTIFSKMFESDGFKGSHLKKLKNIWCGGDSISQTFVDNFNKTLTKYGSTAQLMLGYGLTEACGVVSANTKNCCKRGSVGKPLKNITCEIWDECENRVKNGKVGEITLSSPQNMSGYIDDDMPFVLKGNKSFIKTGDLGYLDDDGFLYFVERKKRVIKINSVNIYPAEIENVISKMAYVSGVLVTPYNDCDKIFFKAYVVLKSGVYDKQKCRDEIINQCTQNLIKYAIPQKILFVNEIKRTNLGKIDYDSMR